MDKRYFRRELSRFRPTGNTSLFQLLLALLKFIDILKYRGNRGGRHKVETQPNLIITVAQGRRFKRSQESKINARERVLIPIPRSNVIAAPDSRFVVPKCLLLNIFNLLKLKNGFRTSIALKIDPGERGGGGLPYNSDRCDRPTP